jgi:tight adherence protein B
MIVRPYPSSALLQALQLTVAAVPLVWPPHRPSRRRLAAVPALALPGGSHRTIAYPSVRSRRLPYVSRGTWWHAPPLLVLAVGLAGGALVALVLRAPFAVVLLPTLLLWSRRRAERAARRRAAAARRRAAITLCTVLRAELLAGRSTLDALVEGCDAAGDLGGELVAGLRSGADPVAVLRHAARHDGADSLALLAACWQVTATTGAGLRHATDRLEQALRSAESDRADLTAELGGVRFTASMLAGLPLLAIGIGGLAGGNPLHLLLGSTTGIACLAAGLALEAAGISWVDRIASRAEATL